MARFDPNIKFNLPMSKEKAKKLDAKLNEYSEKNADKSLKLCETDQELFAATSAIITKVQRFERALYKTEKLFEEMGLADDNTTGEAKRVVYKQLLAECSALVSAYKEGKFTVK